MNIYVAHSREFNFEEELYKPIRESSLNSKHDFILPHEESNAPTSSKDYFENECKLVIAEVSYPSTGMGIELGWADASDVTVVCIHRDNTKPSTSLKTVTDNFIEYSSPEDLINKLESYLSK